jgi:hypothetical protein
MNEVLRRCLRGGITRRPRFEELLLAENQSVDIVWGEFDAVPMGDRVGGASLDAVAAKDAARIINIVNGCVALTGRDSLGFGIFPSLDVDAIRGARGGAKKASDAFLQSVLVTLKDVYSAIARLNAGRHLREAFGGRLPEHGPEGDAETLEERHKRLADFSND